MAYVKSTSNPFKENKKITRSLKYIMNKAEYIHTENCLGTPLEISNDFEQTRKLFNQDKGRLAHHFIQSFSPNDNVTPEQAHQIGIEFLLKVFPNYQVVLATHKDKDHIHNHFILNSCNLETGNKWLDNKTSIRMLREESDILCKKNNLSVIDSKKKYKSIDQATFNLAVKEKSWKVFLTKDLNKALEECKSKEEFLKFLDKKNYIVRYTDNHITIRKMGEKKGIRVDTLAKQFGERYTKQNMERRMGYGEEKEIFIPIEKENKEMKTSTPAHQPPVAVNEWCKYEKWYFSDRNTRLPKPIGILTPVQLLKSPKRTLLRLTIKIIFYLFLRNRKVKKYYVQKKYKVTPLQQAENAWKRNQQALCIYGNIPYKKLCNAIGENCYFKIDSYKLLALENQPFFYSAKVNLADGKATVTVKENNLPLVAKALGINNTEKLKVHSNNLGNAKVYSRLKNKAQADNVKLEYLVIEKDKLKILKENYVEFAYFEKGDKFNIAFLPKEKERIYKVVYGNQTLKTETDLQRNSRINNEIKKFCSQNAEKPLYRLVSFEELKELKKYENEIMFAYFKKHKIGKYNIVFTEKDLTKVNELLKIQSQVTKPKRNPTIEKGLTL